MQNPVLRKSSYIISALFATLALTGCDRKVNETAVAPSPTVKVATAVDDSALTTKVKTLLLADPDVKGLDITVETNKGVVQLSGFVDNPTQANRAAEIARNTQGVAQVQNKMGIRQGPDTVAATVDDSALTIKVKSALLAAPEVKSYDIAITSNKGVVQLSGFVDSPAQVSRASEVARSVNGVTQVENKLSIKK